MPKQSLSGMRYYTLSEVRGRMYASIVFGFGLGVAITIAVLSLSGAL